MTEKILLRDVVEEDLEVFFAHEHDPENVRRSHFPPRERERFMTHWRERILGDSTGLVQTVEVDGKVAGGVLAWWDGDRRFLGYVFGREFWGRGIGTRAVAAFLELEPNRPLHADPYVGNEGSVRLLKRLGFQRTGSEWNGEDEHVMLVLGGPDSPA
ncbi:GNAT family N-acetyltransferase [Streptomyces sp. CMB-StM0423]|uniref:GNAT family N-acetyltransferase n=1 Tax=Streptomyces sp. CMB-StM0423 TaxID=2059884 RepID=UPI0018FEF2F5|nr:GNAT family N-acetyltransferase [Streptomyces sp. CMB-StM0423]